MVAKKLDLVAWCKTGIVVGVSVMAPCVLAQSKIQCEYNMSTERYEAPLAWQNTIGANRANAMCASASVLSAAQSSASSQRTQNSPTKTAISDKQGFLITDGDKASDVLRKWASSYGYEFVWDAPTQSDLTMSTGKIEATDLVDAINKLVAALNVKVTAKRKGSDPQSQFAFPVEALAYSDKVIAITVKQ